MTTNALLSDVEILHDKIGGAVVDETTACIRI